MSGPMLGAGCRAIVKDMAPFLRELNSVQGGFRAAVCK